MKQVIQIAMYDSRDRALGSIFIDDLVLNDTGIGWCEWDAYVASNLVMSFPDYMWWGEAMEVEPCNKDYIKALYRFHRKSEI